MHQAEIDVGSTFLDVATDHSDPQEEIKQLRAGSTRAPAELTRIALTPVCTPEQYYLIISAFYTVLDDRHLEALKADKSLPVQQALCLTGLATIIAKRYVSPEVHGTLEALGIRFAELHRWILYLKVNFVDQESVDISFRLLARRGILDFLGICDEYLLDHMSDYIAASPGLVSTLFSLWHMEVQDDRFSHPLDSSSPPIFHTSAILDSWMCMFSQRERWDWPEILRPFGDQPDALAAAALDHLQRDIARVPINYDLIIWDIHIITTLSINNAIRIFLLNRQSMTILASVVDSMVGRYTTTDQPALVAKCISYGYWYIRAYVESTDGLPWVIQIVQCGILSSILSTEPWFKYLGGQESEDWEPLFLLLGEIMPKFSMYSSVLRPMIKQLAAIDANGLPGKLEKDGLLFRSWFRFLNLARTKRYVSSLLLLSLATTCSAIQCDKSAPPGSFKSYAGCLHVHYCSKECQVYDWKNGGHQKYCRDIQVRRADGLVSRLSKRDVRFINRVIAQDLHFFRDRIQIAALESDPDPVVIELDYTEIPVRINIGSIHTVSEIKTCECDESIAKKWNHMIELAQKSTSKRILLRAFLLGGTSEKVKLQCLPLKRVIGDHISTEEEPTSEFDETFDLLYSRAGQSFGIVDAAFPEEAVRAMREKAEKDGTDKPNARLHSKTLC